MSSFAHVQHPGQYYAILRADRAAQGFQHVSFAIESLTRLAHRVTAAIKPAFARWVAARKQAAEDRLFLELALTDRRVLEEIRAIRDHADADGAGF